MIEIIIPTAIIVFESLCQILFLDTFLVKRERMTNGRYKILSVVVLIMFNIGFASTFFPSDEFLNVISRWLVFSLLVFIVARIFYKGKTLLIAIISSLVYIAVQFSDFIGISILALLGIDINAAFSLSNVQGIVSSLGLSAAVKLVLLVVVLLIRYLMSVFGNQYYATRVYMKARNWLLILIVPIMGILSIWAISTLADPEKQSSPIFLFISVGWLFVSIIVAYVAFVSSVYEQQLREQKMMQEKMKQGEEYYSIKRKKYEQLQSLQHDVLNHFMFLKNSLKMGESAKALQYIESVLGDNSNSITAIDTNHETINILLNEKINQCRELDIGMVFKINDLSAVPLEDKDIVTILSNLLDNAIEACEKCSNNRVIDIKFIQDSNRIVLSVKNPYVGQLRVQGDKYMTSKGDDFFHGIGITSVENCLEKYNGVYAIDGTNNRFQFTAVIPNKCLSQAV